MYEDATTAVRVNGRDNKAFGVSVSVHQGSLHSPLLFVIVQVAYWREFREGLPVELSEGLPMELLYADDLVLIAEMEELLVEKIQKWKQSMKEKGLRVNLGKTKVMKCEARFRPTENLGKKPFGVCKKGVGSGSINCNQCSQWIHGRCSVVSGKLQNGAVYNVTGVLMGSCFKKSCHESDMISSLAKLESNPMRCDGSRPKASMSTSDQIIRFYTSLRLPITAMSAYQSNIISWLTQILHKRFLNTLVDSALTIMLGRLVYSILQ